MVTQMSSLQSIFQNRCGLRFLFTGGKGGVGKTVIASAMAYHFSEQGKKILLASLNPVHSLSSVFQQELSGGSVKPVAGVPNLYAIEVEIQEVVQRYRENIGKRVRDFLKWSDIPLDAKPFVDIAATNPAFEESAMFDKMIDLMLIWSREVNSTGRNESRDGGQTAPTFDLIIFDTAAVANAIRLIGLSKIYGLWLQRMIESRKEALSLRVQLSFRKEKIMEEVRKDPLLADLLDMNERYIRARALLTDPQITAFFFVTLPLALPIAVVTRFIQMVQQYDIPVGGVIVNGMMDESILMQNPGDEYLQNRWEEQKRYLSIIQRDLGHLVCAHTSLLPGEVVGLEALATIASSLFSP